MRIVRTGGSSGRTRSRSRSSREPSPSDPQDAPQPQAGAPAAATAAPGSATSAAQQVQAGGSTGKLGRVLGSVASCGRGRLPKVKKHGRGAPGRLQAVQEEGGPGLPTSTRAGGEGEPRQQQPAQGAAGSGSSSSSSSRNTSATAAIADVTSLVFAKESKGTALTFLVLRCVCLAVHMGVPPVH